MASLGIDRVNAAPLADFAHVEQSIGVILTTPIGSRVMRRDFGSELFDLIDRPMTQRIILAAYAAVVTAITRWEPRFRVTFCGASRASEDGVLVMQLAGTYYPRGHLGDFTVAEDDRRVFVRIARET